METASYELSREESIYSPGEFCKGQPLVLVPEDWARRMNVYKRAGWDEIVGHGYGSCKIESGAEMARMAATVYLAGGGPSLIWVQGHDGTVVGFVERLYDGSYQFCG